MKKKEKQKGKASVNAKMSRREREAREAQSGRAVKIFVTVFAIVAVAAILALTLTLVGINIYNSIKIDYEKDNLKRYIYISEDDYRNFGITVNVDKITDTHVEDYILKTLHARRTISATSAGYHTKSELDGVVRPVQVGDNVYICYNSYYIDDEGGRVEVNNVFSSGGELCEVGEGAYPVGVEVGLLGTKIEDHTVKYINENNARPIQLGDRIAITYMGLYADGSSTDGEVSRIVTVDPEVCDPIYGEGFADYLIGKGIGTFDEMYRDDVDKYFYFEEEDGRSMYFDIKVSAIYEVGEPLIVEGDYSINYDDEVLAGKTVTFEIFFRKTQFYDTPEFNEEFINDKMGITDEMLAEWGDDGDSAVDKCRAYIKNALTESEKSASREEIELAMWEYLVNCAEVKWLPNGAVDEYYNDYVAGFKNDYYEAGDNYSSLDDYISARLDLKAGDDWREVVRERSKLAVTEKLVFYYIIRNEGFLPSDEEYRELGEEFKTQYIEEQLIAMNCVESAFKTQEEYLEMKESISANIRSIITDAFVRENVVYSYCMPKVVELIDVTYLEH